ncbi:NitT/TauT family transport system substrate-binding protein [Janthinobacterium sp. CG_23.3]|uniref:ABC transporter substrate-binding protein n=1 Tax=Janthinobacterium sp. CG_23.3 TaxID=3349634 RepID=UPI0038D4DCFF
MKRLAIAVAIAGVLVGAPAAAQQLAPPQQVKILLNWFAQPDHAGYWQAQRDKLGRADGIAISVVQGGPKIQTIPQVAAGQAEFGIGNADDVLLARLRGAPVRAVFAHLDHVPYALVYHAGAAEASIQQLRQRTFSVNIGSAYWEWAKKQYRLGATRDIPVTGDLGLFRSDTNIVQQGYSLYLPARMAAAGVPVRQIKLAALGYRPYAVLFTTDAMIKNNPALVRATIAAVRQGWSTYLRQPDGVKPMLTTMNPQISPALYDSASKEIRATLAPADLGQLGCMSPARWRELAAQLRSVHFLPAGFDESLAYDRSFIAGCPT